MQQAALPAGTKMKAVISRLCARLAPPDSSLGTTTQDTERTIRFPKQAHAKVGGRSHAAVGSEASRKRAPLSLPCCPCNVCAERTCANPDGSGDAVVCEPLTVQEIAARDSSLCHDDVTALINELFDSTTTDFDGVAVAGLCFEPERRRDAVLSRFFSSTFGTLEGMSMPASVTPRRALPSQAFCVHATWSTRETLPSIHP